jgi:hypothetical protein
MPRQTRNSTWSTVRRVDQDQVRRQRDVIFIFRDVHRLLWRCGATPDAETCQQSFACWRDMIGYLYILNPIREKHCRPNPVN